MLFIFKTVLVVLFRWIHLASGHRCILGLVPSISCSIENYFPELLGKGISDAIFLAMFFFPETLEIANLSTVQYLQLVKQK